MNTTLPIYQIKYIVIGLILLSAIGAGLFSLSASQDNRNLATSQSGTAKYIFTKTSPTAIQISASGTGQSLVDGFQLIAELSGTIPSDIRIVPTAPSGLNPVSSSFSDTSTGKKLTLVFVSANPQAPFQANSASVVLGNLQFTPPATGSMVITVDQLATKILQNSTGLDLLGPIAPATISIGSSTPSPVATTLPPPPTLTPFPTATPTPTINPTPAPTPMTTPTPVVIAPPPDQSESQVFRIAIGSRDANEEGNRVIADESTLWIGNGSLATSFTAFQFGTTLTPKTTIGSAWIELYTPKEVWIPLKIEVRGLLPSGSNHSAPFVPSSPPSSRILTAASTLITTNEKTPAGNWQKIDVTTIVQEIVNHPEFANHPEKIVSFLFKGTGAKFARKYVSSFESGGVTGPILRVSTTPKETPLVTPAPTPSSAPRQNTNIGNWLKRLFRR